jgi:hypothetical protein
VNAGTMPATQLAMLLAQTAGGIRAESAAVALISAHGHFLHEPAFRRIIAAGSAAGPGEPAAVIRWNAAIWALEHGRLTGSPSEKAVLRIAASIAEPGIAVRLGASLGSLDRRNIALVTAAITAANG